MQLFALLEMFFTAAGNVQHDDFFGIDLSGFHGFDQRSERDAGSGVDVHAFGFLEQFLRGTGLFVRGYEDVSASVDQCIEQPAADRVGGLAVRQNLRVDRFGVDPGLIVVVREHGARTCPPGIVHRDERQVLRYHQFHLVRAEAAVLDQALIRFPCRNSPCAAADCLEVIIRNAADEGRGRKYGRCHAVAACDVLGTAFGEEFIGFEHQVAQVDRIEIVAAFTRRDQFDTVVERGVEPKCIEVVFRYAQQQRNAVVRADARESAGRIPCRCHYQHFVCMVFAEASANRVGLGLLE